MADAGMGADWPALITAATALAAVVIGPAVSWRIADRQIRATNVASKRQDWIDAFRNDLAEALALTARLGALRRAQRPQLLEETQFRTEELLARIRLRLSPGEEHAAIRRALEGLRAVAAGSAADGGEAETARERCLAEAHDVLRKGGVTSRHVTPPGPDSASGNRAAASAGTRRAPARCRPSPPRRCRPLVTTPAG